MWFFFCFWFLGEFYYLDGTILHLDNQVTLKTAEEIREDHYHYFWREEGVYVSVEKHRVKALEYFSLRVPGKRPGKSFPSTVQRRIEGRPIVYQKGGSSYLKFRHVDRKGKSAEGAVLLNQLKALKVDQLGEKNQSLTAVFSKVTPHSTTRIVFYDRQGRLLYQAFLEMSGTSGSLRKKRKKGRVFQFETPSISDFNQLGLVEVVSEGARAKQDP